MSVESFQESAVEQFGSLVTCVDPSDVPNGLSPDNQDVAFYPGGVRTRPGLLAAYTEIGDGLRRVLSIARSLVPDQIFYVDDAGTIYTDDGGVRTAIATTSAGNRLRALPLYGSDFIGVHNGAIGSDVPLRVSEGVLDRVSMCGPGDAPSATQPMGTAINIAGYTRTAGVVTMTLQGLAIDQVSRAASVATCHTTAPHGFSVGQKVNTGGLSDVTFDLIGVTITAATAQTFSFACAGADLGLTAMAGYVLANIASGQAVTVAGVLLTSINGTWQVTGVPAYNQIKYNAAGVDADGTGLAAGTVTPIAQGSLSFGQRKIVYWWITRSGYWTKFSPPYSVITQGGGKLIVSIGTGPANVVARGVAITLANGASYYHNAAQMLVQDNATTQVTIDITDTALGASLNVDYLQDLEVLNYALAPIAYNGRLVWIGEENGQPGFNNFGFEGGIRAGSGCPMGWTEGASFAGGSVQAPGGAYGCVYRLSGNGVTAIRGQISQNIARDAWTNSPTLQPGKAYNLRFRARRSIGGSNLSLQLLATGTGVNYSVTVLVPSLPGSPWHEYEAQLLPALAAIPADLLLTVQLIATAPNGQYVELDELRLVPADEPLRSSFVRVSLSEQPEAYQGSDGFLMVDENDGQQLLGGFVIRNLLYLCKERSLHVTADDGMNEANQWTVEPVDSRVGIAGPDAYDLGNGWAILANESGAYFFNGGTPINITREIQNEDPTKGLWGRINWGEAGRKVWVKVNIQKRRIFFGVPLDAETECNRVLYLDYSDVGSGGGMPTFGLLVDPLDNNGRGRKWSPWTIAASAMEILEPGNLELLGNSGGTGKIYLLDESTAGDDGAAIDGYYDTAYLGGSGFGERLFGYLVAAVEGAGKLLMRMTRPGAARYVDLPQRTLASPCQRDLELPTNVLDNRVSYRFRTNAIGSWFSIAKLRIYSKQNPWAGGR